MCFTFVGAEIGNKIEETCFKENCISRGNVLRKYGFIGKYFLHYYHANKPGPQGDAALKF